MPNNIEYLSIIGALKRLLKHKKITYKDLATEINMSEAGVKRLLNSKDCSLGRILQICEVLDIELAEIVEMSKEEETVDFKFQERALELFEDCPEYLKYFYLIQIEQMTPKEIEKKYNLKKESTRKYLSKLSSFNLIQVNANDEVVSQETAIVWKDRGKTISNFKSNCVKTVIDRITQESNDSYFPFYYLGLKENTQKDYVNAIHNLNNEFINRAIRESKITSEEKLRSTCISIQITNGSFVESLPEL